MARTVNEYVVLLVRPLTAQDVEVAVHRNVEVGVTPRTEYEVIARPPLLVGGFQVIVAADKVVTTRSIVGALGTVGIEYEDVAAIDEPMAFSADTDIEIAASDERPTMEHVRTSGLAGMHVPIELVTEYD